LAYKSSVILVENGNTFLTSTSCLFTSATEHRTHWYRL